MYSAQPGLVSSPLYSKGDHKKATMLAVEFFQSFYGQSPVRGCRSLLRAATDPNLVGKHPALLCILRGGLSGMSSHVPVQEEVGSTSVLSTCRC